MKKAVLPPILHASIQYKKKKIPAALREQVWIQRMGPVFEAKCHVSWCANRISAFNFQCGHNIPESKGGETSITNLFPICARCNMSMGNQYTIDEWSAMGAAGAATKEVPCVSRSGCWMCFC
jgi:hypothetical protein